jgi:hypothetical protein
VYYIVDVCPIESLYYVLVVLYFGALVLVRLYDGKKMNRCSSRLRFSIAKD